MVTTFSAENISYALNTTSDNFLFYNINFNFKGGDIVCFLGKNGSGKSSLFKICMGISDPTYGNIFFNQKNLSCISLAERATQMAWLSQELTRPESFKVTDFLSLTHQPSMDADTALKQFQLESIRKKELSVLSGGEWRWLQLARIWSMKAKVIFLDEPESDLDLHHKFDLIEKCKSYVKKNNSILFIATHDILFAHAVATKICALSEKLLVWNSEAAPFWDSEAVLKLFELKGRNIYVQKNFIGS